MKTVNHWIGGKTVEGASGNWGPEAAHAMLARDGRVWRRP